jgi:hypothetical protein
MSETNAELGYGMLLKMLTSTGPDVYTTLGRQRDVMPPDGFSVDMVDATHNESDDTTEEVIPGIVRTKSMTVEIEYNMNGTTVQTIHTAKRVKTTFRTVHPTGKYIQWTGYIEDFEAEAPTEDKQNGTLTIKRSGAFSRHAAAQPENLVLPHMAGLNEVGGTIWFFPGIWANEPTGFAYQLYHDATEIAAIDGATGPVSYVLQEGDDGESLVLGVVASNSAGSNEAFSAPSAAVVTP